MLKGVKKATFSVAFDRNYGRFFSSCVSLKDNKKINIFNCYC